MVVAVAGDENQISSSFCFYLGSLLDNLVWSCDRFNFLLAAVCIYLRLPVMSPGYQTPTLTQRTIQPGVTTVGPVLLIAWDRAASQPCWVLEQCRSDLVWISHRKPCEEEWHNVTVAVKHISTHRMTLAQPKCFVGTNRCVTVSASHFHPSSHIVITCQMKLWNVAKWRFVISASPLLDPKTIQRPAINKDKKQTYPAEPFKIKLWLWPLPVSVTTLPERFSNFSRL